MKEVFGIPVDTLLVVLLVGLGISLCALAALALRNPILVKLAVRSVGRRRGRSALIVVGLMLGTTIIAAALTTGDTMSHTIKATTVSTLGATDETIAPKGATDDIPGALGAATGTGWVDESDGDPHRVGRGGVRPRRRDHGRDRRPGGCPGSDCRSERAERRPLRRRPDQDGRVLADPRFCRSHAVARRPASARGLSEREGRARAPCRGRRSHRHLCRRTRLSLPACATSSDSTVPGRPTPPCSCPSIRHRSCSTAAARSSSSPCRIAEGTSPEHASRTTSSRSFSRSRTSSGSRSRHSRRTRSRTPTPRATPSWLSSRPSGRSRSRRASC